MLIKQEKKKTFQLKKKVVLDDTSSSKGHNYCSIFVDLESSKLIFATPGKKTEAISEIKVNFEEHVVFRVKSLIFVWICLLSLFQV